MKKRILTACAALAVLLTASATLSATTPEFASCGARDARNASAGESSQCIKVAIRGETEGLRPAVMHASVMTPSKVDVRQPEQRGLPEPGNWATLLAGLLGALAIARRRVS